MNKSVFKYSFLSVSRRKNRAIIIFCVSVIVFSLVFTTSIIVSTAKYTLTLTYNSQRASDVVIYTVEDKWFNDSVLYWLKNHFPEISGVSKVVSYHTLLNVKEKSLNVIVYGIQKNPTVDTVPLIDWSIFMGQVAIIDSGTADYYSVGRGDQIYLLGTNFTIIEIKDLLWAPSYKYGSQGSVIIPIEVFSKIIGVDNEFNEIHIKLKDRSRISQFIYNVVEDLKQMNYNVSIHVKGFSIDVLLSSINPILQLAYYISIGIIIAVISGFLVIDIRDRANEIGVLKSIGMGRREIALIFALQIVIIFSLAIPLSLISSYLVTKNIILSLTIVPETEILIAVDWLDIMARGFFALVFAFLFSFLLAYYYAGKISRELLKKGSIEDYNIKHPIFKRGNFYFRFALRTIFARKTRSIMLIIVIILGSVLPSLFTIIARESVFQIDEHLGLENKWDIAVHSSMPINHSIIDEIRKFEGVERVESIFYVPVPVTTLGSNSKTIVPMLNVLIAVGLYGNETLKKLIFKEGALDESGIVVSEKIAKVLQVGVNDYISIKVIHPLGTVITTNVKITGIVETYDAGGWVIFIHMNRIYEMTDEDARNYLMIKVENPELLEAVSRKITDFIIKNKLSARVISMKKLKEALKTKLENAQGFVTILEMVIMLGSWLGMLLIWVLDLFIRRWNIALLKSMGADLRQISAFYLAEGSLLILISVLISSCLLSILVNVTVELINITALPIWLAPAIRTIDITSMIIKIIIMMLTALIPAILNIYRKQPMEILREIR